MDHPVYPCGDCAVTIQVGDLICEEVHCRVMQVLDALRLANIAGVQEMVPTYTTVCVHYDPAVLPYKQLVDRLRSLELAEETADSARKGRVVTIPVCYGGEHGPDLSFVAAHCGMTPEQVILQHSEREYLVYMLGFLPGFAYMGGMDERIACPRLESPRTRIPAGSVGIAGTQTGIYPLASPGGWQLIGRTPLKLFQMENGRTDFLLSAGDRVKFNPITLEEYRRLEGGL